MDDNPDIRYSFPVGVRILPLRQELQISINRREQKMFENTLVNRNWLVDQPASEDHLTILQWNCLADWASDSFPRVNPEFLSWSYRRPLIVAECLRAKPDIICLQEVDHFDELKCGLQSMYDGYYKRKQKKGQGEGRDGNAVFWKRDRLEPSGIGDFHYWQTCKDHPEMGQLFTTSRFQVKNSNSKTETIRIVTTHLKAKVGFEEQRRLQCNAIAKYLNTDAPSFDLTVICGDFNTDPDSQAVKELIANTNSVDLKSAYRTVAQTKTGEDSEPEWTTWKIREAVKKKTIDFIFHDQNSKWKPVDVWKMPCDKLIDPSVGLPCANYPSDHCALAAKFQKSL